MNGPALPTDPLLRGVMFNGTLAFVAGYVDVVGFVALFGLFTAHVTGNLALIGAQIAAQSAGGVIAKLLALPVFVLLVAMVRLLVLHLERVGRDTLRPVLLLELIGLALFLAVSLEARRSEDPDALIVILAGMTGVAAMAIQNAGGRLVLANHPSTTAMTGNMTQFVIDLVDILRGSSAAGEAVRKRFAQMGPALLIFTVGALAGAAAYAFLSFWCLLIPIAAILVLTIAAPGK